MRIIGMDGNGNYIAVVEHTELEKLTDKYYGKLTKLSVGATLNLGAGYDFRSDIQQACKSMVDADANFDRARKTLHKFAVMVASLPAAEELAAERVA
jgi:hypothetical protein